MTLKRALKTILIIYSVLVIGHLDAFAQICEPITAPVVIVEDGCYRLTNDFQTDSSNVVAITVNDASVEIDLDDHTIKSTAPGSVAAGIQVVDSEVFTLMNGHVEGFLYGVRVDNKTEMLSRATITNLTAKGGARGIYVNADEVVVKDSTFREIDGYEGWPQAHSIGVEVISSHCLITGNLFEEIYPLSTAEGVAISVTAPPKNCTVINNRIINMKQPRVGRSIAIWLGGRPKEDSGVEVSSNHVLGYSYAFMASADFHPGINSNSFVVDCGPDKVRTYGETTKTNQFRPSGNSCRDLVSVLRDYASDGDPEWKIRLAAALLEDQEFWSAPKKRCVALLEAANILKRLVMLVQAEEQMKRIKGMQSACPEFQFE